MPKRPPHTPLVEMKTSEAREKLAAIIAHVQKPRSALVLTRYGRAVAAVVSMDELDRIYKQQAMEDIIHHGRRPSMFRFGKGLEVSSEQEAAEHIQRVQLDRRTEREVLKRAGLDVVPGGEVVEEMEGVVEGERGSKRWWWLW